jgi:hypothetical protein
MTVLGVVVAAAAVGALVLGAWRAPAPDVVAPAVPAVSGSELGNGRPAVISYDGLMVRRCTAVAVFGGAAGIRRSLQVSARRAGFALVDLPPDVLSPVTLQKQVPEVVECLPAGASSADAARLLAPVSEHHLVESVLVHDLTFSVRPARPPAAVAAALDREGILADSLGRYQVRVDGPALRILYTGLLLGDDEIGTVQAAIARQAGTTPDAVSVGPRSPTGTGVILADEPAPPAPLPETADHHN